MARTISDILLFFVTGFALFFLLTNYDPDLATVFLFLSVFGIILYQFDVTSKGGVRIPFERDTNRVQGFLVALAGYGLFLALAFVLTFILKGTATLLSLQSLISDTFAQISPAFAGSALFMFIAFGILIPFVESTTFFGYGAEFIADRLNIRYDLKDVRFHVFSVFIGLAFLMYHITARGLPATIGGAFNDPGLAITGAFGYVSMLLVAYTRQTREATFMHIIANSIATLRKLGISII
jgi:hypothetical protein